MIIAVQTKQVKKPAEQVLAFGDPGNRFCVLWMYRKEQSSEQANQVYIGGPLFEAGG
jgi:hypothetical protein